MIPEFPKMKPIELSDKEEVEKITKKYPPYSDFNFVSMWSWDIKGEMRLSILNSNLVVRFTDYLTGNPFYSFLGDNKVDNTIEELLKLSKKEGLIPELKLIPEHSIKGFDENKYKLIEDRDNFDYVYSISKLANFLGPDHSNSRRLINRFIKRNPNIKVRNLDLTKKEDADEIIKLDNFWKKNKKANFDSKNEEKALIKLLKGASTFPLFNIGIFLDNELVSLTINEKLNNKYSISHFAKFNISHSGSYLHSMKILNEKLHKENYDCINCEQDLGLLGLRTSKKALCPVFYLKKYILKEN